MYDPHVIRAVPELPKSASPLAGAPEQVSAEVEYAALAGRSSPVASYIAMFPPSSPQNVAGE